MPRPLPVGLAGRIHRLDRLVPAYHPPQFLPRARVALSNRGVPVHDNPHANKLMVHMLAAFAEHEREQISQRTKDALAAAKARGIRLGRNAADRLAPAHRAEAMARARQLAPLLAELKRGGLSARQMAVQLTARDIPTPI